MKTLKTSTTVLKSKIASAKKVRLGLKKELVTVRGLLEDEDNKDNLKKIKKLINNS